MEQDVVQKKYEEMHRAKAAYNREFGDEINLAIPMYEDPTRYPVKDLLELWEIQRKFKVELPEAEKAALKKEYAAKRESIHLLPDAPERIYLWKEGNMPQQTVYTENPDHEYDHEPDFKPYYLEVLQDKEPIGGIVLVAGGTHGFGTISECYQDALEFNERGYQCFILQCRPNNGPWCRLDTATDAARAFQMIRANAEKYHLDPDKIAYAGFSNGGVTGDALAEFYSEHQQVKQYYPDYVPDEYDAYYGAQNAYLCIYGVRHVGTTLTRDKFAYPPVFFAVGRTDYNCINNLEHFLPWIWENKVPHEIHTFAGHPHGFAGAKIMMGDKSDANYDLWVTHADVFLRNLFCGYEWKFGE